MRFSHKNHLFRSRSYEIIKMCLRAELTSAKDAQRYQVDWFFRIVRDDEVHSSAERPSLVVVARVPPDARISQNSQAPYNVFYRNIQLRSPAPLSLRFDQTSNPLFSCKHDLSVPQSAGKLIQLSLSPKSVPDRSWVRL